MKKNCPSCKVPIDAATSGTTAPGTVVADLRAHPATNVAVFVSLQIAQGLPAAMRAAGLPGILTVGRGPIPGNLQDIKNGALTAALAIGAPVSTWTAVDSAPRLLEGDQPTASEQAGDLDEQFPEQKDITFDPTDGGPGTPLSRTNMPRCGILAAEHGDLRNRRFRRLHADPGATVKVRGVADADGTALHSCGVSVSSGPV
jgi:ribose transport system substrate-binding protein